MAMKGKAWGLTEDLLTNGQIEIHRVKIKRGMSCSEHRHAARYNAFYVIAGKLDLHVERGGPGSPARWWGTVTLGPGDFATVEPHEWHKFEALTDVEALEIYYPAPVLSADIERR